MATTSFKKEFRVTDQSAADQLKRDVDSNVSCVEYEKVDEVLNKEREEKLLARLALA